MQEPEELNVLDGHEDTHFPSDARRLLAHVRQKVAEPAHEPHDESQAKNIHY